MCILMQKDASAKIDDLETAKRDALETLTAVLLHLESSNGCVLSRPGQIFEVSVWWAATLVTSRDIRVERL